MNVVSCSFGQTSGYMLHKLIWGNRRCFSKDFLVVFENTGKEHDKTLEFGHQIETRWGIKINWLEYTRVPATQIPTDVYPEGRQRDNLKKKQDAGETDHWFKVVDYSTAKRDSDNDTPFDELLGWANTLPNTRTRMCSVQLKIRTRDRFLRSIGVLDFDSYIGIRADEAHRVNEILTNVDKYETPHFPLVTDKVTKRDVDSFWDRQPFRLEIPNYMGNCKFCFLKRYWKRIRVAQEDPSAIEWAARQEEVFKNKCSGAGAFFRDNQSYAGVIADSKHPEFDLGDEDVPCSCSIGGYRNKNNDE